MQKIFIFIFLLFIFGCGQSFNSNYNDKGQYSPIEIDVSTPAGQRLAAAYKILQPKCMGCHEWANYNTNDIWLESGYVTAGNFNGSLLIANLKNYGGNMPKDPDTALTADQITTLQTWINNL